MQIVYGILRGRLTCGAGPYNIIYTCTSDMVKVYCVPGVCIFYFLVKKFKNGRCKGKNINRENSAKYK